MLEVSMMDAARLERSVAALVAAADTGVPIAPLTTQGELTIGDAYMIQLGLVDHRRAAGRRVIGHKVGLTSEAMRQMFGVDQPDFGHLLDDMLMDDGDTVPLERFIAPKVEPEVAFVLREALAGPGVTMEDAVRAVDFILPAIEIIDSRIADWQISLADSIADNASCGALVVGSQRAELRDTDLRSMGCSMSRNGTVVETGSTGAVMGNPVRSLVWLANVLGAHGTPLQAGGIVISGSCTAAIPVESGDAISVAFDGLGSVAANFGALHVGGV